MRAYADAAGLLEQMASPGWPEQSDEHHLRPSDRRRIVSDDGWTESHGHGIASALSASVVDLPQGRYVRLEVNSNPPVRLDMEPDGALWLAQELLNARNEAKGSDVGFPIKTLLMLGGER